MIKSVRRSPIPPGQGPAGRRVLVTSSDDYMGPAISARFAEAGCEVIADPGHYLDDADEPARVVGNAGEIDILIVNLVPHVDRVFQRLENTDEAVWNHMFDAMVHPLMRFVKAALPQMTARHAGKIIAVTSAAPLRGVPGSSAYSAARGAQNAFVRAVGAEVAPHNVQVNAIGQAYVYGGYPENALEIPAIRDQVERDVPARRLAEGWEQAELALYLAGPGSDFICGQVIPYAGGWVAQG